MIAQIDVVWPEVWPVVMSYFNHMHLGSGYFVGQYSLIIPNEVITGNTLKIVFGCVNQLLSLKTKYLCESISCTGTDKGSSW